MMAELDQAIATTDLPLFERAAHTLKGAVSNFGALAAAEAAFILEKMGRAGDLNGVEDARASLGVELQRLDPELVAFAQIA
jgi:HPt (histidine-containing phosphotransfer) domain-containing protein